jgi:NADH-quinone oxidoreductase subunit J
MTAEGLGLGAVATVALAASLGVVLARNLFHAVLWLALTLVATAGLFLLLQAEFLAAVQLLLYAGGVVTIVVFAIMLTERLVGQSLVETNRGLGWGALGAVAVFAIVAGVVLGIPVPPAPGGAAGPPGDATATLGRALLTTWVLPFEALSVLFVAALLGALYLAREQD